MKKKNDYTMITCAIFRDQKRCLMKESYKRSMKAGKRISEGALIREALNQYFGLQPQKKK